MEVLFPNGSGHTLSPAPERHAYLFEVSNPTQPARGIRTFILNDWCASDSTQSWLRQNGYDVTVKAVLHEPTGDEIDALLACITEVNLSEYVLR